MAKNLTKQILEKFDSLSEQDLITVLDNYANLIKSVNTKKSEIQLSMEYQGTIDTNTEMTNYKIKNNKINQRDFSPKAA